MPELEGAPDPAQALADLVSRLEGDREAAHRIAATGRSLMEARAMAGEGRLSIAAWQEGRRFHDVCCRPPTAAVSGVGLAGPPVTRAAAPPPQEVLTLDAIQRYWATLLTRYAALQRFRPSLHPDALPLEKVCGAGRKSGLAPAVALRACQCWYAAGRVAGARAGA